MGYDDEVDARGVYDAMAAAYVADESNAYNSLYERPAMLGLLGDVRGRSVLDLGAGAGALAVELVARGAGPVVGVDVSPEMVAVARARAVGATFVVGDVADGALRAFADGAFDLVAASLMMHYVRDWEPVLGELARVLAPGGRIVFSTHHPEMTARAFPATQGKDVALVCDRWEKGGEGFDVRFYARSLAAMEASIAASGLVLERWVEPQPLPACEVADPVAWERLTTLPWFVFGVLSAGACSS
ncbi:class I SAM-dependent methyltransferase [Conexibacter woesei]|uniref:class I SAM-dependent methyltransferase n=1 Tax=Conexibacter woesei TaxID=191495 RepID=UPI0004014706|nr:class I SAM-dependent methyltransferase [Conexibacter woesei]